MRFIEILRMVLGNDAADEYLASQDQPYVVVIVGDELLHQLRLDESGDWTKSEIKNLFYRVDSKNDNMRQQRHIHISHKKHLHSPGQQVAWNNDQSRHDRHNFNNGFSGMTSAKSLAARVLGVSDPNLFENVIEGEGYVHLTEDVVNRSKYFYLILR